MVGAEEPETKEGARVTWAARLRLLPGGTRRFVAALLLLALLPPAILVVGRIGPNIWLLNLLAGSPLLLISSMLAVGGLWLVLWEPPGTASLAAYATQVRARLSSTLFHYDAALWRHSQESRDADGKN
jgi:hypothetical protein